MGLKALTFDFWGTLYQNTYARHERVSLLEDTLQHHGYRQTWQTLDAAYDHARLVWEQVWREEQRSISIERWVDELLGYVGAELPKDSQVALGRAMETVSLQGNKPRLVPGVTEAVPRLAGRFRLGVISDTGLTPGRVLRQVMRRDRVLRYFDALTFSDEFGRAKPRPEPFLCTLDLLDVRPAEAAHIGDLPETDLRGAREVGMKAILFLGMSNREDGRGLADGVFEDYSELEELLESVR
jgi:HAD superfamily hydrolase (TIGR01549 family)